MSETDSPRSSVCSDDSEIPTLEFHSPSQVEELMELYIEKYNDVLCLLETYEANDDDIQELREKTLDKFEYEVLAEAYEAAGKEKTAESLREQAEECDERIEELRESIENIEDIKDHFYEMYKVEVKRETYEIYIKACEKYLQLYNKQKSVETKKNAIRPASPRRYPKAASPSRLNPEKDSTPPRRESTPPPAKRETRKEEPKEEPKRKVLEEVIKPSKKEEPVVEEKSTERGQPPPLPPPPAIKVPSISSMKGKKKK